MIDVHCNSLSSLQEAFRSVEDIHGLMSMVKKTPKPSLLVVYYAKLTEIFWISSSHLYHAYAWLKLFHLQKSFNKNLSQKDLQLIASSVVLAVLSVSPYEDSRKKSYVDLQNQKERNLRMSDLIGFNVDPKSDSRELVSVVLKISYYFMLYAIFLLLIYLSPCCSFPGHLFWLNWYEKIIV